MSTSRPAILTALLLAAAGAALSGCVAYDPYYPAYGEPVLVPPPTVYAVPPPVVVQPSYRYRAWRDNGWHGNGWRGNGWRGDRGWRGRNHHHGWGHGGPHGPRGWR